MLGNLINRCLSFVEKNFEARVPPAGNLEETDLAIFAAIRGAGDRIGGALEEFQVRRATADLMELARTGNKYFNDAAPWAVMKKDRARCATILNTTIQLQAALAVLMEPFLPFSAEKLWRMLNAPGSHRDRRWHTIPDLRLPDGHPLGKREILFGKIEDAGIEEQIAKLKGAG